MKLLAAISILVTLANANPLRRDGRSIDEFHANFMEEQKTLIAAESVCKTQQYYDLELETCKDCEKHCPANVCGQCKAYYEQKSSTETIESINGKLSLSQINEGIQWALLVALLAFFCFAVITINRLKREVNKLSKPVTEDRNPHDKHKSTGEMFDATVETNKTPSEQNNREDNEAAASHSGSPYQRGSPGQQETTVGRDGQSAKVVGGVKH